MQVEDKNLVCGWVLEIARSIPRLDFREQVLRLLVKVYDRDYHAIVQCFIHLDDATSCAALVSNLASEKVF